MLECAESAISWRSWAISIEIQASGGAVTTGVPRRFVAHNNDVRAASAGLFDPEFAPALWTDIAVDQRAGIRLLK